MSHSNCLKKRLILNET